MKRLNFAGLFLLILVVSILAGCCVKPILKSSYRTKQYAAADTSWWGKSGAKSAPVKDAYTAKDTSNPTATVEKKGSWWMPERAPKGKGNTVWGNKGYVYMADVKEAPKKKEPSRKAALQDVYFALNSAELTSSAKKVLDANVDFLKNYPKAKIVLAGSASPEGPDDHNLKLSERRALAVKNYLVKKGIPEGSVSVKVLGGIAVDKSAYPSARKVQVKMVSW